MSTTNDLPPSGNPDEAVTSVVAAETENDMMRTHRCLVMTLEDWNSEIPKVCSKPFFFAWPVLTSTTAPPAQPPRPLAAPSSLKKAGSPSPDRRKVSFQEGPPTEIDGVETGRSPPPNGGKSSKWQPLANVEPSPVAENDPFSLGDSDDEKETKTKEKTTVPESDQLKQATTEAISSEIGSKDKKDESASK